MSSLRPRVRAPRSPQARAPGDGAMSALDRRILGVLCKHRVVTQEQLERLFPDVSERTLRYRTRRLHEVGLAGRSRPYRERGSAPNHHWPTRRADCVMRGDPAPRGGDRRAPNPVFLAHAVALTELYVTLATGADAVGLALEYYGREGEARESFTHMGKERALAPDAMIVLADAEGRKLGAFVEVDLGTMSHARLRQKAELYAAYVASDAWSGRHLFLPALLFLTTTDVRAARFLKALAGMLKLGPRFPGRRPFVAAAAEGAWTPGRLLGEPCLRDLDGNTGLALVDVLRRARVPYEQEQAHRREGREAEAQRRRALCEDPGEMREHLRRHEGSLVSYAKALGPLGGETFALLTASTHEPTPQECATLRAIADDLREALPELHLGTLSTPGAAVSGETAMLTESYRAGQLQDVAALGERYGKVPSLRRAEGHLRAGGLLDALALRGLAREAEQDIASRAGREERGQAYLQWREHEASRLVREGGPLGRLRHRPEDFYTQLDHQTLRVCRRCRELVFPPAHRPGGYTDKPRWECHYCHDNHGMDPFQGALVIRKEAHE